MKKIIFLLTIFPILAIGQDSDIQLNGTISAQNNPIKNIARPDRCARRCNKKLRGYQFK